MRTTHAAATTGGTRRRTAQDKNVCSELAADLTASSSFEMSLMARREGVALFLGAVALALFGSCGAICPMCTCSGAGGVVTSVSCSHMSMDMYGIPDNIPSTTEFL